MAPGPIPYEHVAAGHKGMLFDPELEAVIKPCTQQEIDFYQTIGKAQSPLCDFMPQFMGVLVSNESKENLDASSDPILVTDAAEIPSLIAGINGSQHVSQNEASKKEKGEWKPSQGAAIQTDQCIVLENVLQGMLCPNVIDLKLGKRLYADDAPEPKKRRLDEVSANSTSSSHGFRIAGTRVWRAARNANGSSHTESNGGSNAPDIGEYQILDRSYGKSLKAEKLPEAFDDFFTDESTSTLDPESRLTLLENIASEIHDLAETYADQDVRLYSSSLLLAWEGSSKRIEDIFAKSQQPTKNGQNDGLNGSHAAIESGKTQDEESEEDDEQPEKLWAVNLIDFAHASLTPGLGRDDNVCQGLESIQELLAGTIQRYRIKHGINQIT